MTKVIKRSYIDWKDKTISTYAPQNRTKIKFKVLRTKLIQLQLKNFELIKILNNLVNIYRFITTNIFIKIYWKKGDLVVTSNENH